MMDLKTMEIMEKEAGRKARKEEIEPLIAEYNGDEGIFKCPDLGNYKPRGWKKVQEFFVDSSGFGGKNEPALTINQFLKKVKEGFGYAITQAGQFQVYIGEYKRK